MPKTGGSSFLATLENHFGEALLKDYNDIPINTHYVKRNAAALCKCVINNFHIFDNIKCIHGHFLPLKYRLVLKSNNTNFVTWLRDPVERMVSHYYYWKRNYRPATAPALHRKVIQENWSLERFCLGPELQNLYSQFLWGFPPDLFNFIGITEYYLEDFNFFTNTFLGISLPQEKKNINSKKENEKYINDPAFRAEIEFHHQKDMNIYQMALAKRQKRISQK